MQSMIVELKNAIIRIRQETEHALIQAARYRQKLLDLGIDHEDEDPKP